MRVRVRVNSHMVFADLREERIRPYTAQSETFLSAELARLGRADAARLLEDQSGRSTKLVDGATVPRDLTLLSAQPSLALQVGMCDGLEIPMCTRSIDKSLSECNLMQFVVGSDGRR